MEEDPTSATPTDQPSADVLGDSANAQAKEEASQDIISSVQGAGDSVTVSGSSMSSSPETSEMKKQDDFVIFHCVSYLGAAIIKVRLLITDLCYSQKWQLLYKLNGILNVYPFSFNFRNLGVNRKFKKLWRF